MKLSIFFVVVVVVLYGALHITNTMKSRQLVDKCISEGGDVVTTDSGVECYKPWTIIGFGVKSDG